MCTCPASDVWRQMWPGNAVRLALPLAPSHGISPALRVSSPMQVLKDIPLYVVTNDKVGLLGTRECAIRIVEQMREELTIAT